ncbi:MAG: cytochrome C, partial [Nitrospirae bacterium]|nr:cytochrome C [Nitrospirota bacterium]
MRSLRKAWSLTAMILLLLMVRERPLFAFDLLKGVMPGDVSSLHEKVEGNCLDCHTIGQKHFFSKCVNCHKESGKDVDQKKGFHGKIDSSQCETCHSEHKGRAYVLIELDPLKFDHKKTEFELLGKHQKTICSECHTKHKFRETPHPCLNCHQTDDKHKGGLGKECERCHNPNDWKEIKFDHTKTKFALEGKHAPVKCEKCHTK